MSSPLLYTIPPIDISDKVCVVGSSGSLLDASLGSLIDSYDDVVRFNRAPTDGYEDIVGSKTTLRVVNSHVIQCFPGDWKVDRYLFYNRTIRSFPNIF